ncbi:MAG TPA: hypothetical protein VED20_14360 [Streptosporangiaceae bacterium]|nr:hypothetical protein [Streptosporangiaceae bacterium]
MPIKTCLNGRTTRAGTFESALGDTVVLDDGRPASGNSELVRVAVRLASEAR